MRLNECLEGIRFRFKGGDTIWMIPLFLVMPGTLTEEIATNGMCLVATVNPETDSIIIGRFPGVWEVEVVDDR